ncbi:PHD and RING finger domain-containing protein 1 [Chlorella vulgaris]
MADSDSFCQICGDTGGATRMLQCENADRGCLGGIHLYCTIPVRSEPPTDAWYCFECQAARQAMEAHFIEQAQQRAKSRGADAASGHEEQGRRKRRRRQQTESTAGQEQQPPLQPTQPKRIIGVSAAVAAAANRTPAGASKPSRATGGTAGSARPAPPKLPAAGVASRDTLALLFESLKKGDEEAAQRRLKDMSRVVDGTSRRSTASIGQQQAEYQQLAAQHSLHSCSMAGQLGTVPLVLPVAQERQSFHAYLRCYPIPGNPESGAAAARLRSLAAAVEAGQQLATRLVSHDELGISQQRTYQVACLLLALDAQSAAAAPQWASLWEWLSRWRQAVAIEVPLGSSPKAAGGSAAAGTSAEELWFYLVPNMLDPDSRSLFGLLANPIRSLDTARPLAAAQPLRSSMKLKRRSLAGGEAARAPSLNRLPVAWADGGLEDKPVAARGAALELPLGPHYAPPSQHVTRPQRSTRLPSIRSFSQPGAAEEGAAKSLEGLRVALVGFEKQAQAPMLEQLRSLGASVFTNQVVVADVLCLHTPVLDSFNDISKAFPLGLAHLLASMPVHAYSSTACLHEMLRLRRRLQGAEWRAPNLQPVFPAGLLVVLDASALLCIQSADLTAVLSEVRRLKAEADEADAASCLWHVVAAPSDLVALQAAARAGNAAASDCWQVWQAWQSEAQHEGIARPLAGQEMSGSNNPGDPAPAVKHALKCAILVHRLRCRLTYLCKTLAQAEVRDTILSGDVADLLEFLQGRQGAGG